MLNTAILSYVTFVYFLAFLFYLLMMVIRKEVLGQIATVITLAGLIGNSVGLGMRWIESYKLGIGHAPLSNLYESLIFFSWAIILLYVLMEWRIKNRSIGTFVTPLAFLSLAYASFAGSVEDHIQPLIPALQSNWLTSHVITCFLGYAAFAVSFGLSFMYILRGLNNLNPFSTNGRLCLKKYIDICIIVFLIIISQFVIYVFLFDELIAYIQFGIIDLKSFLSFIAICLYFLILGAVILIYIFQSIRRMHDLGRNGFNLLIPIYNFYLLFKKGFDENNSYGPPDRHYDDFCTRLLRILPNHKIIDELNYQMLIIGFLMLTIGIITGSVWANSAWGSYWSWDPKETWSLITWFVYAAMLHSRLISGWKGKRLAIFSIIGFFCVMFTYFGVNFLLAGLHSYGS